ncbi:hypothetical protein LCGC14_2883960 [marine sediment metagenome]|uniref:HTH arsR-type domain-containing protein n=1 Tax=marine sediment metagenome TaxID=412755 RepID=A0A0F9A796_9ZZZZ|nr:MAG: hypothetical protein HeimC3_02610 [Candidatus Heimdallarchaeota archaeon LC_3]
MVRCISENNLSDILAHPVTARVFIYLRQQNRPAGVREIQKKLNLGSSSTSYWHLNKLHQEHVIEQLPGNKYQLSQEYMKINKIPLTVKLDHYIVGGKAVPGLLLLISFIMLVILAMFGMIMFQLWIQIAIIGLIALIVTLVFLIDFYKNLRFDYHQNSENKMN